MAKIGSFKIFLRDAYKRDSDGKSPIYLRIIIRQKKTELSLDEWCKKNDWNAKKGRMKDSAKDSFNVNKLLDQREKKASDIFFDYKIKDKPISIDQFKAHFNESFYGSESFYDFMEYVVKNNDSTLKKSTLKTYTTQISKLKKFRPNLTLSEVNQPEFIGEYTNYMKRLENCDNTINKARSWIRAQIHRAVELNRIDKQNAVHIKVSKIVGEREYLSIQELNELEMLYESDGLKKNLKEVLSYFLFCCYTGLRYSDIKQLRHKNIQGDWLSVKTEKTDKTVKVPLIDKSKRLIKPGIPEQRVFKVLASQPTNRYLKDLMTEVKITKQISFHCARHTFATCALDLDIPLEIVSDILGHTEIQTTRIYAKITDPTKKKAMDKFNQLPEPKEPGEGND